ncbi:general secretion pathway protein GspB [Vibrio sp. ABG19]|uniref:general secretion pathway protein GspB n=1 Tax=Vibrio sp. ABG19 TaxID=2817385 RepID=UPI00249E0991|nr:general secretion pathway protein GspB [Vibrio sp. ABG19]WGY47886.1 general secretion pathway protein GspB [Vibrio sp. ABG19]
MSQVMKALQRSEASHQQYSAQAAQMMLPDTAHRQRGFRWYHALWLLVPGIVTAVVVAVQSYQHQQARIAALGDIGPSVVQVPASVEQLDYPDFGPLARSEVEVPEFDQSAADELMASESVGANEPAEAVPVALASAANQVPLVSNSRRLTAAQSEAEMDRQNQQALRSLDLSQLSPQMAARVESVLQQDDTAAAQQNEHHDEDAIALVQHSNEFSGYLPAMNFQTHVYASNAVKRWIKVNGVEYQEGDKIFDNVQLVAIKPQSTIILFGQQPIEIPALYDWRG